MNGGFLSKNLKKVRAESKMSQNKLGDILGVSGAYIQQLEKGIKTNPSIDLIYQIATYFDISPMKLLEWDLSEKYQDFSEESELSKILRDQALKKDKNYNTVKYFEELFLKPSEWEENRNLKKELKKVEAIDILLKENGYNVSDFTDEEYEKIEKSLIEYLSTIAYIKKNNQE